MHPLIYEFSADGKREEQVSRKLEMNLRRSIEVLLQTCEYFCVISWLYVGLRIEIIQNQFIYFFNINYWQQTVFVLFRFINSSWTSALSERKCSKRLSVSPVPLLNHSTRSMLYFSACSLNEMWWDHYYFHHVHLKMNWETLLLFVYFQKWKFCHLHFQTWMIYFWGTQKKILWKMLFFPPP